MNLKFSTTMLRKINDKAMPTGGTLKDYNEVFLTTYLWLCKSIRCSYFCAKFFFS